MIFFGGCGIRGGTSQQRMARHDQSRFVCVGWRSGDLPTDIAPRHPIRVARLGSWLKARAKPSARVPKVARRRTRIRSWGAGRRAVTSPKRRLGDLPRPRSSHLSQIARQNPRRTSNTNHVPFASAFRIEWTSGASAPECGGVAAVVAKRQTRRTWPVSWRCHETFIFRAGPFSFRAKPRWFL